jgi:hypothetical protein
LNRTIHPSIGREGKWPCLEHICFIISRKCKQTRQWQCCYKKVNEVVLFDFLYDFQETKLIQCLYLILRVSCSPNVNDVSRLHFWTFSNSLYKYSHTYSTFGNAFWCRHEDNDAMHHLYHKFRRWMFIIQDTGIISAIQPGMRSQFNSNFMIEELPYTFYIICRKWLFVWTNYRKWTSE